MKGKKKGWLWVGAVLLALILLGFNQRLKIVHYAVEAGDLPQPIRLALITDLHSCSYGQDMGQLIDAIDSGKPDAILLGGDIFDDILPNHNARTLLEVIGGRYPCYYVTGNHEYWSGKEAFDEMMAVLEECGIIRLQGEKAMLEIKGSRIGLYGLDDPAAWENGGEYEALGTAGFEKQLAQLAALKTEEDFSILLTHRPEAIDLYNQYDFDLILAGHAHGGQWRIPGLINGLFAPNQGLFPQYAGGKYKADDAALIISRGLARESTRIPRYYNRPELVMVELQ